MQAIEPSYFLCLMTLQGLPKSPKLIWTNMAKSASLF